MENTTLQRPSTGDEYEITPNVIWENGAENVETLQGFFLRLARHL
jgi:hypothetical protein